VAAVLPCVLFAGAFAFAQCLVGCTAAGEKIKDGAAHTVKSPCTCHVADSQERKEEYCIILILGAISYTM
jgi:hypothetical protein